MLLQDELGDRVKKRKTLSDKLLARQKEIEFFMKYGCDRKKHKKNDSTESSSEGTQKVAEEFYNDDVEAISPYFTPEPNPKKVETEELDQELGASNVTKPNAFRQLSLLLSNVTLVNSNLVFIQCYIEHGGAYFLIPYSVMLFVFGVPMAVFELSLAQFSSVPIFGLFKRMNPILGGIPYILLITRIIYTILLFEPRYSLFTAQSFSAILSSDSQWMNCSIYEGIRCYDPSIVCPLGQYQINGQCKPFLDKDVVDTSKQYTVIQYYMDRDSRYISLTPSDIFNSIKQMDRHASLFTLFVTMLVSAYICYRGHRFFSYCATLFFVLPILGMLPTVIFVYLDSANVRGKMLSELAAINKPEKLSMWSTWIMAARVTAKTMNIGDGTLVTLGSMAGFRHNLFKDAILLAAVGGIYRVLSCIAIFPVLYAGNELVRPYADSILADPDTFTVTHASELLFSSLPLFKFSGLENTGKFSFLALFYSTVNLSYITFQVVTFEMFTSWLYSLFPRIMYLKKKIIRISTIAIAISCLVICYSFRTSSDQKFIDNSQNENDGIYLMSLLAVCSFYQIVSVAFSQGYKKMIVNTMTILKPHRKSFHLFHRLRVIFYIMWVLVLPIMSALTFYRTVLPFYEKCDIVSLKLTFITGFPIFYAIKKIVDNTLEHKLEHLASNAKWDPTSNANAQFVLSDARAVGM